MQVLEADVNSCRKHVEIVEIFVQVLDGTMMKTTSIIISSGTFLDWLHSLIMFIDNSVVHHWIAFYLAWQKLICPPPFLAKFSLLRKILAFFMQPRNPDLIWAGSLGGRDLLPPNSKNGIAVNVTLL